MKFFTTLIPFVITHFLAAQLSQAEPKEISALRESWLRAKFQATEPLDRKYADALKTLKLRYTKEGNLESALAADAELKKLETATGSEHRSLAASPSENQPKLPEAGVVWTVLDDSDLIEMEYQDSGRMTIQRKGGKVFSGWKWVILDNQQVLITMSGLPPNTLTLAADKKGNWVGKFPDGREITLKPETK